MLIFLQILCGDLVILWRTAVVWHNSVIMRRLNYAFLVLIIRGYFPCPTVTLLTAPLVTWAAGVALLAIFGLRFLLLPLALSLTVNLWSTAAIGYKTW